MTKLISINPFATLELLCGIIKIIENLLRQGKVINMDEMNYKKAMPCHYVNLCCLSLVITIHKMSIIMSVIESCLER